MSEISENEIKSMTKEQNYMRGYEDGRADILDKIRAEIENDWQLKREPSAPFCCGLRKALEIIDKHIGKENNGKQHNRIPTRIL